jgi:dihydrofolate reductase
VNVKGLKMCCTSSGVDESDHDMFWNDSEEDENVRRMTMLTVKMETVTLLGKGR